MELYLPIALLVILLAVLLVLKKRQKAAGQGKSKSSVRKNHQSG